MEPAPLYRSVAVVRKPALFIGIIFLDLFVIRSFTVDWAGKVSVIVFGLAVVERYLPKRYPSTGLDLVLSLSSTKCHSELSTLPMTLTLVPFGMVNMISNSVPGFVRRLVSAVTWPVLFKGIIFCGLPLWLFFALVVDEECFAVFGGEEFVEFPPCSMTVL